MSGKAKSVRRTKATAPFGRNRAKGPRREAVRCVECHQLEIKRRVEDIERCFSGRLAEVDDPSARERAGALAELLTSNKLRPWAFIAGTQFAVQKMVLETAAVHPLVRCGDRREFDVASFRDRLLELTEATEQA